VEVKKAIYWLLPLCAILIALYGPRVWAGSMNLDPWGVFWFTVPGGRPLSGFPDMYFASADECEDFAREQLASVTAAKGPVRFRCLLLPFYEA